MVKVKKVLILLLCMFTLNTTVRAEGYSLSSIDLIQNVGGDVEYTTEYTVTEVDGVKSIAVKFSLTNNTSQQQNPSVIVTLSKQALLEAFVAENVNLDPGAQQEKTITVDIPSGEDYSIKTMVWRVFSGMSPIGISKTVNLDNYGKTRNLIVNASANTEFKVHLNSLNARGNDASVKHRISYDPQKVVPTDLCAFTHEKELSQGCAENTYIVIEKADFENGIIEYSLTYPTGRITGTSNVITFKALSDLQNEEIAYTIW